MTLLILLWRFRAFGLLWATTFTSGLVARTLRLVLGTLFARLAIAFSRKRSLI